MIFTEIRFLAFFLIAFVVHWILPTNRTRKVWLLLCSYFFYGAWDWRFLSLIASSSSASSSAFSFTSRSFWKKSRSQ